MKLIGLTGTIGSGKSTASKIFQQLGAHIIDADALAHQATAINQPAWHKIKRLFGADFFDQNNNLLRRKLANKVFNDKQALQILNDIVHNEVQQLFLEQKKQILAKHKQPIIIYDVPLLFETNMSAMFQKVILIYCNIKIANLRLTSSRNISIAQINKIRKQQMPQYQKMKLADYLINNNGSYGELQKNINTTWQKINNL